MTSTPKRRGYLFNGPAPHLVVSSSFTVKESPVLVRTAMQNKDLVSLQVTKDGTTVDVYRNGEKIILDGDERMQHIEFLPGVYSFTTPADSATVLWFEEISNFDVSFNENGAVQ